MAQTQFRTTNPTQERGWDDLIRAHSASVFFHSSAWSEVLQQSYGHKAFYLLATEPALDPQRPAPGPSGFQTGVVRGVLPLMEVDSRWTGRRGVCLPFTDACPPLLSDSVSYDALFGAAVDLGRERGWRYLEIRGEPLPEGGVPSLTYFGHRLALSSREEQVEAGFRPSVRQAWRKAGREGVVCQIDRSYEALRAFYGLHRGTRRRHGLPPQPFYFFQNVFGCLLSKGASFVALVRWGGTPVAAAVFFCQGRKAVFKYGASDVRRQHLRGSDFAMVEAIRWLCRNGFNELDFGRTSIDNEGLRRFKRGFGAQEFRHHYVRYDLKQRQFVRAKDLAGGWVTRLFGCVPAPVAGGLGRLLYRHLS